jgi:hypothetical protein
MATPRDVQIWTGAVRVCLKLLQDPRPRAARHRRHQRPRPRPRRRHRQSPEMAGPRQFRDDSDLRSAQDEGRGLADVQSELLISTLPEREDGLGNVGVEPGAVLALGSLMMCRAHEGPCVPRTLRRRNRLAAYGVRLFASPSPARPLGHAAPTGLIASGWHTCAIAMELMVRNVLSESESFGSPGIESLKWLHPVIALRFEVLRSSKSPFGRTGNLLSKSKLWNQNDALALRDLDCFIECQG